MAGTTPVLVHNTSSASCDLTALKDYANQERTPPPGVRRTSVVTQITQQTPSGLYVVMAKSQPRTLLDVPNDMEIFVLDRKIHLGCGEIGCLARMIEDGVDPTGATSTSLFVRGPDSKDAGLHGSVIDPCGRCKATLDHLGVDWTSADG